MFIFFFNSFSLSLDKVIPYILSLFVALKYWYSHSENLCICCSHCQELKPPSITPFTYLTLFCILQVSSQTMPFSGFCLIHIPSYHFFHFMIMHVLVWLIKAYYSHEISFMKQAECKFPPLSFCPLARSKTTINVE